MSSKSSKQFQTESFLTKFRQKIDRYVSYRRLEIKRGHVKESLWLTARQGLIHIFTVVILTLIMFNLCSQNYFTVTAFEQAFYGGEFYYRPWPGHPDPKFPVRLTMENVTNTLAFWDYMSTHFIRLYTLHGNPPALLGPNHILGVARMRQIRVDKQSCLVETALRDFITNCYGFFKSCEEDHEPFGPGTPTAWVYSPPEVPGYPSYTGYFGTYTGGGYYVDIPQDYNEAKSLMEELKEKNWIDRQTRHIFVHVCMYNSNSNNFWVVQLNFEFAPIGRILPTVRAVWLTLIDSKNPYCYFLTACRVYFVIYTLCTTVAHALNIMLMGRSYLFMMGHYVELTSLLLSWMFVCEDAIYWYSVHNEIPALGSVAHYGSHLQFTRDRIDLSITTGSLTLLLLVVLILEFLDFGGSSPLVLTLLSSLCDILSFSIIFLLTLFVFSVAAFHLFGQYVESMRGVPHSFFTLFNAVLHSFDYHTILTSSQTFAPVFFIVFTFVFIFVLCNLFVVILNDTYFDVRSKDIKSRGLYDIRSFLNHGFSNIARKLHILRDPSQNAPPRGLSYQCVRSLFHKAWMHWPEMSIFFNRKRVKDAAVANRIDEICVADVRKLKFGYLREAYWEDFERLLMRMSVIRENMCAADNFVAPLVHRDVPGYMRKKIVEEDEQQKSNFLKKQKKEKR